MTSQKLMMKMGILFGIVNARLVEGLGMDIIPQRNKGKNQ